MGDRTDVLFVHNNFPGQFGFLATALKRRGWRCAAIGSATAGSADIPVRHWKLPRGTGKDIFPYAVRAEADLLRARAAAGTALELKAKGFDPAVIVGHPGWGETLLLHDVFPKARQVLHGEFYYHALGADVGFDPEFGQPSQEERWRIEAKNATLALAYLQAQAIVSPTAFQASQFPPAFQPLIHLIHEGVATDHIRPRPQAKLKIKNGPVLDRATPVVTFINRNFEPLRGFHIFMRALPALLQAVPEAHVVLIGNDGAKGYGGQTGADDTWKTRMLKELDGRLDLSRVHFLGKVPHDVMLDAISIGAAHVYYTYPFVLSWSLLEAMACEALVIASDTGPLHDAVTDGVDGRLLPFTDVAALSDAMIAACRRPGDFAHMRAAARRTVVERFDRASRCEPAWLEVIDAARAAARA